MEIYCTALVIDEGKFLLLPKLATKERRSSFALKVSGGSRISRRGGAWTSYGGPWTPKAATFQKILHVKTKESGPVGGGARPP